LSRKPHCGNLYTPAPQIVTKCLTHPGGKELMEVVRRKMRDFGKNLEIKWIV
jgi:hypothetical protein